MSTTKVLLDIALITMFAVLGNTAKTRWGRILGYGLATTFVVFMIIEIAYP